MTRKGEKMPAETRLKISRSIRAMYERRSGQTIVPATGREKILVDTLRLVQRLLHNQQDCYGGSLCPGCDDVRRTVLATIDEVLGERVERREGDGR